MDQDENNLEEGEIQDDDDTEVYTPLERPQTYALDIPQKRFPVDTHYSESEEEQQSSGSDSDLDVGIPRSKKPKKIKVIPKLIPKPNKLKKYDIWSTRAQEDVLAETMNSCDVSIKDRSRNVESYDYSLAAKMYEELEATQGNKRTRADRKNKLFRQKHRSNSPETEIKGTSRLIPDLKVDITSDINEIATDMANKLGEEREDLILRVLDVVGIERTFKIYEEAQRIEKEGGMLIMNQTRRRTPGGVFLFLVRHDKDLNLEERNKIFDEEKQKYKKIIKDKRKEKLQKIKDETKNERRELLPDLLNRAKLFAAQNSNREIKETDEVNCTNPPPSPETDHHESCDGTDSNPQNQISKDFLCSPQKLNDDGLEDSRGKLKTYDDDFLDISLDNEMDLF